MPRLVLPWVGFIVLLAVLLLGLCREDVRIFSYHGLFHASIIAQIGSDGFPPENPLVAGEPLNYPFGAHALLAALQKLLPISAPWLFFWMQIVSLAVAYGAFHYFFRSRSERGGTDGQRWEETLGPLVALCGGCVFAGGPLLDLLRTAGVETETRIIPLVKFLNVTTNPVGVACFVLVLAGLSRLLSARGETAKLAPWMTLAGLTGAGWLYPPAFLSAVVLLLCALAVTLLPSDENWRRRRLVLVLILAVGGAITVPWLWFVQGSASPSVSLHFFMRKLWTAFFSAVLPMIALVLVRRHAAIAGEFKRLLLFWMSSTAGLFIAFFIFHFPTGTEYKFALFAQLPLGLVLATSWLPWAPGHWLGVAAGLALLLLPFASTAWERAVAPGRVEYELDVRGRHIVATDPEEEEVLAWIRDTTPTNAVFVDRALVIPATTGRSLFIGLEPVRHPGRSQPQPETQSGTQTQTGTQTGTQTQTKTQKVRNGWGPMRWVLLEMLQTDPEPVARRRSIAERLLDPKAAHDRRALDMTQAAVGDRALFLVVRSPVAAKSFELSPIWKLVFERSDVTIFQPKEEG